MTFHAAALRVEIEIEEIGMLTALTKVLSEILIPGPKSCRAWSEAQMLVREVFETSLALFTVKAGESWMGRSRDKSR